MRYWSPLRRCTRRRTASFLFLKITFEDNCVCDELFAWSSVLGLFSLILNRAIFFSFTTFLSHYFIVVEGEKKKNDCYTVKTERMSSSDDDWMLQTHPAGGANASSSSGQSAMMDARRRALQKQREAQQERQQQQQQQQQQQRRSQTASRQEAAAPTPAQKSESQLPDFLAGLDDDDDNDNNAVAGDRTASSSTAATSAPATSAPPPPSHEVAVGELQRQIAAKKKQLQATRERETALLEKWRATKAQKQAEVEQLNGTIRRVWAAIEDEKSASETKLREAQDQHEAELRAARRSVEQAVKAEYDTKIAEAQKQLSSAKAEEERLKQLLEDRGGSASAKDIVNTALTAAITAIVHKLDDVFQSEAADGLRMEAWKSELQTLVQREIQTSFAVGVESETQAERDEYARFFSDMLAFWRTAEDEERERLLKMDESLLTDLQEVAQQDLRQLQEEEIAMERVYVESREAWAVEHQKMLQHELEAAVQRREGEMQEQRRQRHELHVERLRDADARHRDAMAKEEALHQQRMEQLRTFFSREEDLRAEQQRIEVAAQESVAQSATVLSSVMASAEETAAALTSYEQTVEEARRQVEEEREQYLVEQAGLLEKLQGLAATQCSNTDAERAALEECAAQLQRTSQTMERHLQDEAAWLAQQEATHTRSREEWEREYRRWQQLVQQERQAAEERFHECLAGLQQGLQLLDAEEREVATEQATLQRTCAEVEAAAQREVEALQQRAAEAQSRSVMMAEMQTRLAQQKDATAEAKAQLTAAQQQLEEEREDLRMDEGRLRDMVEALRVARSRATLRGGSSLLLQQVGDVSPQQQQSCVRNGNDGNGRPTPPSQRAAGASGPDNATTSAGTGATLSAVAKKRRHRSDPNRLPNQIFRELNEQLNHLTSASGGGGGGGGYEAFVPTMPWTDPAYPNSVPRRHQHGDRDVAADQRKSNRLRKVPSPSSDLPPPLSASPQSAWRDRRVRAQRASSPTPQPLRHAPQQSRGLRQRQTPQQHVRHADPSSLPLTSESSLPLSPHGDCDWSPSMNTFTNLVDFSDADTMSQSMR